MSLLVAVPLEPRLTVRSVALGSDAVITNVAGVPCDTTVFVDWILEHRRRQRRHVGAERRAALPVHGGPPERRGRARAARGPM